MAEKPNTTMTSMYKIAYAYSDGKGNKMRTGALLIREKDAETATKTAIKQLSQETDWFKINNVKKVDSDHIQQQL